MPPKVLFFPDLQLYLIWHTLTCRYFSADLFCLSDMDIEMYVIGYQALRLLGWQYLTGDQVVCPILLTDQQLDGIRFVSRQFDLHTWQTENVFDLGKTRFLLPLWGVSVKERRREVERETIPIQWRSTPKMRSSTWWKGHYHYSLGLGSKWVNKLGKLLIDVISTEVMKLKRHNSLFIRCPFAELEISTNAIGSLINIILHLFIQ